MEILLLLVIILMLARGPRRGGGYRARSYIAPSSAPKPTRIPPKYPASSSRPSGAIKPLTRTGRLTDLDGRRD